MKAKNKRAVTVVVTNDYFHHAMVLGRSIKHFEAKSDFVVFVLGYDENDPDYYRTGFTVLDAKLLNEKEWKRFVFQYDGLQAVCALKPLALLYLLTQYEKVIYLDADMKLFGPLEHAWKTLERGDLSLTPHSYLPIKDDGLGPARVTMRLAGIFNAGYVGVSRSGSRFLKWWWEQTNYHCVVAHGRGVFLDQTYLNEATYMVEHLVILKDYSYNVACWNLHERGFKKTSSKKFPYLVNEKPLICFHFSSYFKLIKVRPPLCGEEIFYELYDNYNKEVAHEKNKFLSSEKKYPFNEFEDGQMISASWREFIRRGVPELENVQDPFLLTRFKRAAIEAIMVKRPGDYQPKVERENFFMLPSLVPSKEKAA